ncbi:MAG: MFS transporter [Clostridia bacterium]|nr:MFS transporter [Clostridia bacterium]
MAYQYNINTSKKDTRSSVCLFIDHKLAAIVKLFLSTFLVGYIFSFSGDIYQYIFNVGIYEITTYITLPIVYYLTSYIVDKTNRVWVYRAGILLRTVLVVFAIFYGKDISKLIVLAGFLNGFSEGVYYSSYNTMTQEMVSRKSMKSFMLFSNVVGKLVDVVFPIVLGALIEISTFAQVAIYVFALCVIQIGISAGVRSKKPENSFFSLRQYFHDLKQNEVVFKKMKMIYWISFVYGFTTIISTLINICIMMEFGSNFSLGIFTSIFAAISIVTILIVNKVTKVGKRQVFLSVVAIVPIIFAILFAVMPSIYTLILYNLGNSVGWIIYRTIFDVHRNTNLKESGLYSGITEHQTFMEFMFNISRVSVYGAMMLLGLFQNLIAFKIFLVLMICMASAVVVLLIVYERKFYPNISEEEKSYRIIKSCLLDDKK